MKIDYTDAEHEQHCRAAGCRHPASYPWGQGWCALCRAAALAPPTFSVEPSFGNWLAGLADGEGCFWIHRCKRGEWLSPQFKIKLRDDDRATLVACRDTLGIGNLYDHPAPRTGNGRPSSSWIVQSRADAERLVTVFDVFPLRSKKARDFAVWRRAVELAGTIPRGNRWTGPRDWSGMLALKDELEAVRRYPEAL